MNDYQLRTEARRLASNEDVLCLHAICQPAVTDMQNVIRFQRRQLDQCANAIEYVLLRLSRDERVRDAIGAGTESYIRLTAVLAEVHDRDLDTLRDALLPGSAALHRSRDEDEET